jgi:hypothetical protein
MLRQNGAGVAHRIDDVDARGIVGTGKRDGQSFKQHLPKKQPAIRAELIGSNTSSALGITTRSPSPALTLCRQLLAAGHDATRRIHAYRGGRLCLYVRTIGEAVALETNSAGTGFIAFRGSRAALLVRGKGAA